ncbi:hypothetical protein ALI144C_30695 [Actinosynnema sp. ALI-1.44]|nr:hypothetical protein ALI144C_30695 [Actinosynnema sp. ALI-1.44]
MDIDPDGLVEKIADKLGILDRRVNGEMGRFKAFIESRDCTETGAWRGDVDALTRPAEPGHAAPRAHQSWKDTHHHLDRV